MSFSVLLIGGVIFMPVLICFSPLFYVGYQLFKEKKVKMRTKKKR